MKFRADSRLDLGTFAGIAISVTCIVGALLLEGGRIADITQVTAGLIVLGGTMGAVLVTTPFTTFSSACARLPQAFLVRPQPFGRTLHDLLTLSDQARKNSFASLEDFSWRLKDPFFVKAVNLVADGTGIPDIREIMRLDLACEVERAESEIRVWESAAGFCPTIGILGAILGLIQVMKHLENLDQVGRGIAVAFVATVYGVAAANLFFLPVAGKLRARSLETERLHEMMLEGMLAIVDGLNPSLMRVKLEPFLQSRHDSKRFRTERARAPQVPVGAAPARQAD